MKGRGAIDTLVRKARKDGILVQQPCECCGATSKIHAHHDDYSKPIDIRWLCRGCHRRHHLANGPGKNAILIQHTLVIQRHVHKFFRVEVAGSKLVALRERHGLDRPTFLQTIRVSMPLHRLVRWERQYKSEIPSDFTDRITMAFGTTTAELRG